MTEYEKSICVKDMTRSISDDRSQSDDEVSSGWTKSWTAEEEKKLVRK
jgi:hypothetical protein